MLVVGFGCLVGVVGGLLSLGLVFEWFGFGFGEGSARAIFRNAFLI